METFIKEQSRLSPLYKVTMVSSGNAHYYQIGNDENWLPGVTTILGSAIAKPQLIQWASNSACENIREFLIENALDKPLTRDQIEKACLEGKNIYKKKAAAAADIGTRVHGAVDTIIRGGNPVITDDIKAGVDGFLQWVDSHKLKIEFGDTKLGSKLFGYGGSMDFLAFDGDDPILFDLKTSKKRKDRDHGVYDEMGLQIASYQQAFLETYGLRPKAAYILWVNKEKPEFKAVKLVNTEKSLEGFLAALKLYQLKKFELFENSI